MAISKDKHRFNFLFSTTRQWNPGDEFILFGIRNILKNVGIIYNPIIYNRNPEVLQSFSSWNPLRKITRYIKGQQYWNSFIRLGFFDNSFKLGMEAEFVNLIVFAGSPSWIGRDHSALYKAIATYRLPTIYLGIGSSWFALDKSLDLPLIKQTLQTSRAIIVRDSKTFNALKSFRPIYLPCPALLSAPVEKWIQKVRSIGLIYSTFRTVTNQGVSQVFHKKLTELYRRILEWYRDQYEIAFITHYIDEMPDIYRAVGKDISVFYAYDAEDYIEIYRQFDLVLGARVHGIGMAASLGIPGIYFAHDARAGTVKGFEALSVNLAEIDDMDVLRETINGVIEQVSERNAKLRIHKAATMEAYSQIVREKLADFL